MGRNRAAVRCGGRAGAGVVSAVGMGMRGCGGCCGGLGWGLGMSTEQAVEAARIALRDAEIDNEVAQDAKMIAAYGRCGFYRGHFDFTSLVVGICFGCVFMCLVTALLVAHLR